MYQNKFTFCQILLTIVLPTDCAFFFPVSQFLLYLFFLPYFPTGFYLAPFSSLLITFQITEYKFSNRFFAYLKRELSKQLKNYTFD